MVTVENQGKRKYQLKLGCIIRHHLKRIKDLQPFVSVFISPPLHIPSAFRENNALKQIFLLLSVKLYSRTMEG